MDDVLIQTWASEKSFPKKEGSDDGSGTNFHEQMRSNSTHQATIDPDAAL